ncbi:HlyD family type I secretion periplasmic adaptor subunit [Variovorax ginsengisoli]|jgi:epimerase transport system membrane fusion protein|uniref:Membrane fusion protein (MFP) family protein n=1 Tax=Variovorax ginsengisoli TaxID=363844 RepID=A0ABT8S912_9BURK|nr:HlyD family type I secretion periplasmic adaptor subunit [Variovorax ginsengisoli]MDN8616098.1 HlyD family type I secretion periplasmic adaptor subunit [Variovorax ginsengisoli]MDO1535268.1 HlyD family type I secretion periplasmic adaptor subunit [Variovorax ginsengisoli]
MTHPQAFPSAGKAPRRRTTEQQVRGLVRGGLFTVLGIVVPLGAWIGWAPLAMAVVAPAHVKVDLNRRPVQHLEGGIVRQVLVRDGQVVKEGEPLIIMGDVGVDADRNRLTYRLAVERTTLERLDAEHRRAARLVFSEGLQAEGRKDPRLQDAMAKEAGLFAARQHSLHSELALMKQLRHNVQREIAALEAQGARARESLALQQRDLEANRDLVREGFVSTARINQMEASVADYTSKLEERRSELARGHGRLIDADIKSNSIVNEYLRSASDQLKTTVARVSEIEQELRKSDDATTRQVVLAPASGEIIDLKFTSPGSVVRPGEAIAEIVPSNTALMIEAQIRPEEVNNVLVGQHARIKFTAFKYRNATMVTGKVTYLSGDRFVDKVTQMPYYSVSILADPESVKAVGDLKMQAGMPAEVYIDGGFQTALQYLLDPVTSTLRRAARQM